MRSGRAPGVPLAHGRGQISLVHGRAGRAAVGRMGDLAQQPRRLPGGDISHVLARHGHDTGRPSAAGTICCTAADRAPPPIRKIRLTGTPASSSASTASARTQSRPSTAARARCSRCAVASVIPCSAPVASGLLGCPLAVRYGTSASPPAPAGAFRPARRAGHGRRQQPGRRVEHAGGVERAHRGRCWPVAKTKPAIVPVGPRSGTALTAQATPDVPIETITSRGSAPRPSTAAALSPAPDRAPGRQGRCRRLPGRREHLGQRRRRPGPHASSGSRR